VASDDSSHSKLLERFPNLVSFDPISRNDATKLIEKEKIISIRHFKYMEFWGIGMRKDEPYVQKLGPYLDY